MPWNVVSPIANGGLELVFGIDWMPERMTSNIRAPW